MSCKVWSFCYTTQIYKPGSVSTAIYLAPGLLPGSSHLLGTAGQASCPPHGVAPDRVYIIKPMSPWAGCALTAPFHPYLVGASSISHRIEAFGTDGAVYLCCTCPGVTPGGRYPLSLPCGARTFLMSEPFGFCTRLSDLVATFIVPHRGRKVKPILAGLSAKKSPGALPIKTEQS